MIETLPFLATLAAVPPAGDAGGSADLIGTAWDFVAKGGWWMAPIGATSFVGLAIVIERALTVRLGRVVPRGFLNRLRSVAGDREKALQMCKANSSPIARVLEDAIRRADEPMDALEKHVEEAGAREVLPLRHRMRLLSAMPQVATMLGLLGTVFGMIKTFQAVADSSEALGKTELLAEGIFEAWTCTAGGLLVAIPLIIAYHHLMGRIDVAVEEVDRAAKDWLDREKARAVTASKSVDLRRSPDSIPTDGVIRAAATA